MQNDLLTRWLEARDLPDWVRPLIERVDTLEAELAAEKAAHAAVLLELNADKPRAVTIQRLEDDLEDCRRELAACRRRITNATNALRDA